MSEPAELSRSPPPRPKVDCQVCLCAWRADRMQCRRTCLLLGSLPSLGSLPNPLARREATSEKDPARQALD